MTSTCFYLFGIGKNLAFTEAVVFGDAKLQILAEAGEFAAYGCEVSLDEFDKAAVEANLKKLEWVSRIASEHYRVCAELFRQVVFFLPFRLCTVFSSQLLIETMLTNNLVAFANQQQQLQGKAEFGFKIWGRDEWLTDLTLRQNANLSTLQQSTAGADGKAFFARKKFELELAEAKKQQLAQLERGLAATIVRLLEITPENCKTLALPPVAPDNLLAIANLALLFDSSQLDQLEQLAARLDRELIKDGLIEIIGPLPPYSFVRLSNTL